jgi:hypothetical protein
MNNNEMRLHLCGINPEITALLAAMNENNSHANFTSYSGFEITETRRKYHLLNSILSNGQRSGLFLIDKNTLVVYKSVAYGKAGRQVGTVASLTAQYVAGNASYKARAVAEFVSGNGVVRQ